MRQQWKVHPLYSQKSYKSAPADKRFEILKDVAIGYIETLEAYSGQKISEFNPELEGEFFLALENKDLQKLGLVIKDLILAIDVIVLDQIGD